MARALGHLEAHGIANVPREFGASEAGFDPLATQLMDLFRRTGDAEIFDALVKLCGGQLLRRVRMRARYLWDRLDPNEVVQDVLINIYRYPDRFDASRPSAFRAWSSMIVDNAVRRWHRRHSTGVRLQPIELLSQSPDPGAREPMQEAIDHEALETDLRTYRIFLSIYMTAFQSLSERERFVLQMVEVHGKRYAELAKILKIRPEALKMVVFRARKRIAVRMESIARVC